MAQHIVVQVLDKRGSPVVNERVSIFPTHIRSGGFPDVLTDGTGTASFDIDIAEDEEVILYVKGREQVPRSPLRSLYRIVT